MPLTIEIVTPERKVHTSEADSIVLPTASGQVDILPGHIPLTTVLEPGEIIVTNGGVSEKLVVDKGFVRVLGDAVSILTEAAINEEQIDLDLVAEAEQRAKSRLEAVRTHKEIDPAELEKMEQILRFAAVQRLIKRPGDHRR
ncbi:MAG: ATP synthase F1 subunit epsilon [Puniceicoccales bacterium]|jgi:F-type H+-transporting ATPase subunit epsilon|nr:ATP synthase F1 subunit epsilon [Puniceicoccales bacterium]